MGASCSNAVVSSSSPTELDVVIVNLVATSVEVQSRIAN